MSAHKKGGLLGSHVFHLLIVGFDLRSREIVEYSDVDEDADQASWEIKDPRDDADDGENQGDDSGPRLACP